MLSDYINTVEAAQTLGVSVRAVHRLHESGALQAHKTGQGIRSPKLFKKADVLALAAERAKDGAA